eukprot:Nitzschia sp. Nitz4//scaffold109_size72162//12928//13917//NITZ4_005835-RA/size72162-processed-gene-0.38-mRNA-1//-1//CDS//3329532730//5629//frame0
MAQEPSDIGTRSIQPFEWLTSPQSLIPLVDSLDFGKDDSLAALDVGSGSSTIGEYLVESRDFALVVGIDKDDYTLDRMRQRWEHRSRHSPELLPRLQHHVVDFAKEKIPFPDATFNLVLDKSTMDCTLCSDNATACLLLEVYRSLAIGGVYLVISFHALDYLLPLLSDLPGAHWEITHTTMDRRVEQVGKRSSKSVAVDQVNTEEPDSTVHNSQPLTVLMAKKGQPSDDECHQLVFQDVCDHVHLVNDLWFRESQPLLTHQRQEDLEAAFPHAHSLVDAYPLLFTDAEREHLTYEHFLEDWAVFCEANSKDSLEEVSYETALDFLREMQ